MLTSNRKICLTEIHIMVFNIYVAKSPDYGAWTSFHDKVHVSGALYREYNSVTIVQQHSIFCYYMTV